MCVSVCVCVFVCMCVCDWRTGLWFSETPHCGSVATGVAVPPLLLDDDSLVIAGVIWWLRHFLVLLAFPLRVGSDAHARLVRLRQRREVRVKSRAQKTLMAVCFLLLFVISVYCISVIVLFVLCIFFCFTSIGLTMMVRAESSHWPLPSFDPVLVPSPRRWMERIRNTPRITMTTRKPTHTMMMTVAAPGTTENKQSKKKINVSGCFLYLECWHSKWLHYYIRNRYDTFLVLLLCTLYTAETEQISPMWDK